MRENIGFEVRLTDSHDQAIDKVTDALKAEGFGVLTKIEIDQAFQKKIGKKFRPYTILGAYNPQLAHAALTSAREIGLMLPCNVTVEADIDGSLVRIMNPDIMMQTKELVANDTLRSVATDARQRLQRVAEALRE
ncbi:MAG: DUF302 domain-containing protein [Gammaproteobacteria bacterium]|nr:DUF302 domain-containing protein [Gammaproteobacteria bacterium]MDH3804530.1 DUF302 domain-containing protein [Gammaproteobacteria bacterium]